ncbi:outer membrane protein [Devosia sp.]|uniref:outer membrane protein n=1 Tax=Devosia sp. TaxID=1871048 RepID=UPI003A938F27
MNRISTLLTAGATILMTASAASAADLLVNGPAPSYNDYGGYSTSVGAWDGAYVGAFFGYGWGTLMDDDADLLDSDELGLDGWTLGATLGANFTVGGGFVLGAAGDVAWSGIDGYDSGEGVDYDINWTSSLRGRAGYDAGMFLPYLTAGLAVAGGTASQGPDEDTQVHFGWTGGVGVEVAAADNVTIDLQYRYSDYGQATYDVDGAFDLGLVTHTVTAGVNFKF